MRPSIRILTRADLDEYERRARSRQRTQAVAGLVALMLAAAVVAGLVFAAAWAVVQ